MMMILLPEFAINCCLLACFGHSGGAVLSSDGGSELNCTQGKQGQTGAPMFFFPCQFFAGALLSEHLEQAGFL